MPLLGGTFVVRFYVPFEQFYFIKEVTTLLTKKAAHFHSELAVIQQLGFDFVWNTYCSLSSPKT